MPNNIKPGMLKEKIVDCRRLGGIGPPTVHKQRVRGLLLRVETDDFVKFRATVRDLEGVVYFQVAGFDSAEEATDAGGAAWFVISRLTGDEQDALIRPKAATVVITPKDREKFEAFKERTKKAGGQ